MLETKKVTIKNMYGDVEPEIVITTDDSYVKIDAGIICMSFACDANGDLKAYVADTDEGKVVYHCIVFKEVVEIKSLEDLIALQNRRDSPV